MKALALASVLLIGCGGVTVLDTGEGGAGGQGSPVTQGSTAQSTTQTGIITGPAICDSHQDCPDGVCIFSSGECAPACEGTFCDSCTAGAICNSCATSSCPECADCLGACVPLGIGQCDDNDPCGDQQVCLFGSQQCVPTCFDGFCTDPNTVCEPCATGSCCGCDDCVGACLLVAPG